MKNNYLYDIFIILYVDKRKIKLSKATKYIRIVRLCALNGIIDNTLAYNLTYKILGSIKPFYLNEI